MKGMRYTAVYSTIRDVESLTHEDHKKFGHVGGISDIDAYANLSDYLMNSGEPEAYAIAIPTEEFDGTAKRLGGAFPDNSSAILSYLRKYKGGLKKVSASQLRLMDDVFP